MADRLPRTPSEKMLRAGEDAFVKTLRQYPVMHDGGRIQLLVNVWRAMAAEHEAARLRAGVQASTETKEKP